jgi:tRNA dimethylallyltransferase
VISADALQVYRGLPILTAQPSGPTRLVAIRELDEEMSVGEYATLAHAAIDELVALRGIAIVAGGTGLYLRAALGEMAIPPAVAPEDRARWEAVVDRDPAEAHRRLGAVDPRAAAVVHPNDRRRLVRALELAEAGGSLVPETDRLWSSASRRPTIVVGLELPVDVLEERIRERTRAMFDAGVVDEVQAAMAHGVSRTAEQALGLREIAALAPDEAIDHVILRTRRYAAYQRKWMRRIPGIVTIDAHRPVSVVAEEVVALVRDPEPGASSP